MLSKSFSATAILVMTATPFGWAGGRLIMTKRSAPSGIVLWTDPANIRTRDLYYGIGGKEHEPHGVMTFVKEDTSGSNPKFTVVDENGVKWKAKLGIEAQPETAATRFVWAAGYITDEDYLFKSLKVRNLPAHLKRGDKFRQRDGFFRNVRLERKPEGAKKEQVWKWKNNPFRGTRELNGLRTLMALLNNWDLKDINNSIYETRRTGDGEKLYVVSDLGASFGTTGFILPKSRSRGDLQKYRNSKFLTKAAPEYVDFATPARPNFLFAFNPVDFVRRERVRWIGDKIPREDARWMGNILAKLSDTQIRDAFRSAGYSPSEVDGFTTVVHRRISILEGL
jgi:hypothetical protein